MRDIPIRDADIVARQTFEQYGADMQTMKINTGISAVSGGVAGFMKAGPPGLVIGAALGALSGYWKGKAYRSKVYAQLDALGLFSRPTFRYRDVTTLYGREFTFLRYPYGEQTARIIVPVLKQHYPDMTTMKLTEIGTAAQKSLLQYRRTYPDLPIALAAETILAYFGVVRKDGGEYDLFQPPTNGQHYQPPPKRLPVIDQPDPNEPPAAEASAGDSYLWIGAGILAALLIYRQIT